MFRVYDPGGSAGRRTGAMLCSAILLLAAATMLAACREDFGGEEVGPGNAVQDPPAAILPPGPPPPESDPPELAPPGPSLWPAEVNLSQLTAEPGWGLVFNGPAGQTTRAGTAVAAGKDFNGDGHADLAIGAPEANTQNGRVYVVYGGPDAPETFHGATGFALSTLTVAQGFAVQGATGSRAGTTLAFARFHGAAANANLVIGEPEATGGNGAAWVIRGDAWDGSVTTLAMGGAGGLPTSGARGFRLADLTVFDTSYLAGIQPRNPETALGTALGVTDLNQDGIDDLILGAPEEGSFTRQTGPSTSEVVDIPSRVTAAFGQPGAFTLTAGGVWDAAQATLAPAAGFTFMPAASDNQRFGQSVAPAGDVNGDGVPDLVVGVPAPDCAAPCGGGAYVLFGTPAGDGGDFPAGPGAITAATGVTLANGAPSNLGAHVSAAGDVNGDGIGDLLISDPQAGPGANGAVHVVFGREAWPATVLLPPEGPADVTIYLPEYAPEVWDYLKAVLGGMDLNQDGYADIVISAITDEEGGRVYVVFGGDTLGAETGIVNLNETPLNGSNGFRISATDSAVDHDLGSALASGDMNGDGIPDLIIGAEDRSTPAPGQVAVLFGLPAGGVFPGAVAED